MRIVLAASGVTGHLVLKQLIEDQFVVSAALVPKKTNDAVQNSRNRLLRSVFRQGSRKFLRKIRKTKTRVLDAENPTTWELLKLERPDLLLSAGFPLIFTEEHLSCFNYGGINIHPSLLPSYRGRDPLPWILLSGDSISGVSFHRITEQIDAGPLLKQTCFDLDPSESYSKLEMKGARAAVNGLQDVLQLARTEKVPLMEEGRGSYCRQHQVSDLSICWDRSAVYIEAQTRAFPPPMCARFSYKDRELLVLKASARSGSSNLKAGTVISVGKSCSVSTGDGIIDISLAFTRKGIPFQLIARKGKQCV